jgi:hypothetical protein
MSQILLISKIPPNNALTISNHVDGYVKFSKYSVRSINIQDPSISAAIKSASCIILHYSVVAYPYREDNFISSKLRLELKLSKKPILHMVQDEHRNVLQRVRYFESIGVNHVFSVAPDEITSLLYPASERNFTVSKILTGYVPLDINNWKLKDWAERSIDISYRSRKLPDWYGTLGETKWRIADKLNAIKKFSNLSIDASHQENDRLYGQSWIDFLCNSKVAIGTESGSSNIDIDGQNHEDWQKKETLGEWSPENNMAVDYAAISPRVFEYTAAGCLLALTPGNYSGILIANTHYFEIQPDLSNLDDLVLLMKDPSRRNQMISNAYQELILSGKYSYQSMALAIDQQIEKLALPTNLSPKFNEVNNLNSFTQEKSHNVINSPSPESQKNLRESLITWSMKRGRASRLIIRSVYRFCLSFSRSKMYKSLSFLIFSDSNNLRDFHFIMKHIRSASVSYQILSELTYLQNESQILVNLGARLSMAQTQDALWISWPEAIERESRLKNHPFLDYYKFLDSEGVWFTRSDFSEVSAPLEMKNLSKCYLKNKAVTKELIEYFCKF